ncbi:hypothetical protein T05_10582 [Trichinella murrelli]|uniref:Uncharacterized protein n=1 Tax=Trichinella murrelli TaxID=144512 RepID=A0A0V0T353_9BILA|nr:hypothetical protein T05_6222 [Trichinella murrelli]KRX34273.1 hypothetical protein T05_10582 [Trichinella murrelli]
MLFDKRWRCVTKVQVQEATFRTKNTVFNLIMLGIERNQVAYPTYVSRCLTLRAQCLSFMQIGPLEY